MKAQDFLIKNKIDTSYVQQFNDNGVLIKTISLDVLLEMYAEELKKTKLKNKETVKITQLNYNLLEVVLKDVVYEIVEQPEQESCCYIKTTDWNGKCFKCNKQVFKR